MDWKKRAFDRPLFLLYLGIAVIVGVLVQRIIENSKVVFA